MVTRDSVRVGDQVSVSLARVELRWFFTEGDGSLGLRGSDYQPRGTRSDGAESARSYEAAVVRWSEVVRRLRALPPGYERVLRVAFGPLPPGWPMGLERLYELAGVAALIVERERLAKPVPALRPVVLDPVLDRDTQRSVRSGALVPLPGPQRAEGLIEAARDVVAMKAEKAEALRLAATALLREALTYYVGGSS